MTRWLPEWSKKGTTAILALVALAGCEADGGLETGSGEPVLEAASEKLLGGQFTFARPEVGALYVDGGLCTATLVRPNVVVTAAHCVGFTNVDRPGRNLGEFVVEKSANQRRAFVVDGWASWGGDAGDSDIALVRLAEAVPESVATPVKLASRAPSEGTTVSWFGYGCGRRSGQDNQAGRKQIITFSLGFSDNSCPGDSGGPTLAPDGSVFRVTSGYWIGGGGDIFGEVVTRVRALDAQADAWVAGAGLTPGNDEQPVEDAPIEGKAPEPELDTPAIPLLPDIVSTGIEGSEAWTEWRAVPGVTRYSVFLVAQLASGDIAYIGRTEAGTASDAGTLFTTFNLNSLCRKIPRAARRTPSALFTEVWSGDDQDTARQAALGYTITCR
jgi:hypothetical protein